MIFLLFIALLFMHMAEAGDKATPARKTTAGLNPLAGKEEAAAAWGRVEVKEAVLATKATDGTGWRSELIAVKLNEVIWYGYRIGQSVNFANYVLLGIVVIERYVLDMLIWRP